MSVLRLRLTHTNRHIFIALGGLVLSVIIFSNAWGKHNEVLCTGCHTKPADDSAPYTAEDLVQPRDLLCLACHDANLDVSGLNPPHVVNGRKDLAGGSFTPTLVSDGAGHNIQNRDRTLGLTPPGGGSLEVFDCLSCHDAHDNGNFRNLKKEINGYTTLVKADGDPDFQQNVYISGINDFCGACHEDFNSVGNNRGAGGWTRHPVGIAISSADHADLDHWSRLLNKVTQAEYPSGNPDDIYGARVFCLSCHRAHASPYDNSMRWNHRQKPYGCLECHTF
jgi:predicted CXXCH cytochrome family protein